MTIIKSNRLVFTEGSSDKEYRAQIVKEGNEYKVNFQYGRRNGTLTPGTKTESPVTLEDAEKIFAKLIKSKIVGSGYTLDEQNSSASTFTAVAKKKVGIIPQLLNVLTEKEFIKLFDDESIGFQKKYDGERRLAIKTTESCEGGNRKGDAVSLPSKIIESLKAHAEITLDGEIIGDVLYVFDILDYNGKSFKSEPYTKRLAQLNKLKFGPAVKIAETATTTQAKKELFNKLKASGAEGVVAKRLAAAYSAARPSSGGPALKVKFYKTATVKVSALTKGKRSVQVSVLVGKSFQDVGAVTISPNFEVPKVGDLVEVRYLYAYKGGSLYQPTYLGVRTDLDDEDARAEQLEYKEE
jgi:bifunctional non-homologous end joining protein LigD